MKLVVRVFLLLLLIPAVYLGIYFWFERGSGYQMAVIRIKVNVRGLMYGVHTAYEPHRDVYNIVEEMDLVETTEGSNLFTKRTEGPPPHTTGVLMWGGTKERPYPRHFRCFMVDHAAELVGISESEDGYWLVGTSDVSMDELADPRFDFDAKGIPWEPFNEDRTTHLQKREDLKECYRVSHGYTNLVIAIEKELRGLCVFVVAGNASNGDIRNVMNALELKETAPGSNVFVRQTSGKGPLTKGIVVWGGTAEHPYPRHFRCFVVDEERQRIFISESQDGYWLAGTNEISMDELVDPQADFDKKHICWRSFWEVMTPHPQKRMKIE